MGETTTGPDAKLTMIKAWEDAQRFFEENTDGHKLGNRGDKKLEDILVLLERRYASSTDDKKSDGLKERTKTVCWNVLNGLQVLSEFAEPLVGAVCEPAGICLKATSFLLEIPGRVSDVFAGFSQLFEGIQSFLVQFKILDRIDKTSELPRELIENTNKLMISFVRMCALCYKPIAGGRLARVKIALGAALTKYDQGINSELESFQRLTSQQNNITHAVTLEHVLRSERLIDEGFARTNVRLSGIDHEVRASREELSAVGFGVKSLVSESNSRKQDDRAANVLREVASRLGPDIAEVSEAQMNTIKTIQNQRFPDSASWLQESEDAKELYSPWLNFELENQALLVVAGHQSCGKSHLLSSVLATMERKASTGSRLAVAYYAFPKSNFKHTSQQQHQQQQNTVLPKENAVVTAFKSLAYQVATQAPAYALELRDAPAAAAVTTSTVAAAATKVTATATTNIPFPSAATPSGTVGDGGKGAIVASSDNYEDCWNSLQLSSAKIDLSCAFLIDDIDQLPLNEREELIGLLLDQRARNRGRQIYVRSLVTSTVEAIRETKVQIRGFIMTSMNASDIEKFIARELTDAGAFAEFRRQRPDMLDTFQKGPITKERDYSVIQSRISRVRQAIEDLKPEDDIQEIMDRPLDQEHEEVAQEVIEDLNANLKARDITELNEILAWIYYCPEPLRGKDLEAILRLRGFETEAKYLRTKIAKPLRYARLLQTIDYDHATVEIRSEQIRNALSKLEDARASGNDGAKDKGGGDDDDDDDDEPRMSLNIRINNVPRSVVRHFVWDLNKKLSLDQDFFTQAEVSLQSKESIKLRPLEAFSIMLTQCLELVTDSPRDGTRDIAARLARAMPPILSHALEAEQRIGRRLPGRDEIVIGLLSLLNDVQITVQHFQGAASARDTWLDNHRNVVAIEHWLKGGGDNFDPAETLRSTDKRRLRLVVDNSPRYGYLHKLTVEVGCEWLLNETWEAHRAYDWVDGYLSMLDREIKIDAEAESSKKSTSPGQDGASAVSGNSNDKTATANAKQWNAEAPSERNSYPSSRAANKEQTGATTTPEDDGQTGSKEDGVDGGADEVAAASRNIKSTATIAATTATASASSSILGNDLSETKTEDASEVSGEGKSEGQGEERAKHDVDGQRSKEQKGDKLRQEEVQKEEGRKEGSEGVVGEGSETELTRRKRRIDQALAWVKRVAKIEILSVSSLRRLAETYAHYQHYKDAIDTYLEAVKHGKDSTRLRRGLAYAYAFDGQVTEAAEQMELVFTAYRVSGDAAPANEEELRADHASCARWYEAHAHLYASRRYALSMNHHRDSIDPKALDFSRYVNYVGAAWRANDREQIQELRGKIMEGCSDSSESSPYLTEVLLRLKAGGVVVYIDDSIIPLVRQLRIVHLFSGSLRLALASTKVDNESALWYRMFYAMHLCLASVSQDCSIPNVEECARDLAQYSTRLSVSNNRSESIHLWVANLSCRLYHDLAQMDRARRQMHISQLELVSRLIHNLIPREGYVETATYLCRHYVQTDQVEKARKLVANHVKDAFDLLSDDDPTNDCFAYQHLLDCLIRVGDDSNALAAVSLILLNQRDAFEEYKASKRGSTDVCGGDGEGGKEDQDAAEQGATPWGYASAFYYCDGDCKQLEFSFTDDLWTCRCCPNMDFCAECLDKLREGWLDKFVCNGAHDFFHRPSFDQAYVERVGSGNVEVGGRIVRPGSWEREGGEIIPVTVWLDRLRDEWEIKKHSDEREGEGGNDDHDKGDGQGRNVANSRDDFDDRYW